MGFLCFFLCKAEELATTLWYQAFFLLGCFVLYRGISLDAPGEEGKEANEKEESLSLWQKGSRYTSLSLFSPYSYMWYVSSCACLYWFISEKGAGTKRYPPFFLLDTQKKGQKDDMLQSVQNSVLVSLVLTDILAGCTLYPVDWYQMCH